MRQTVLLGIGPLVSFLAAGLEHHEWVAEQWKRLKPPMPTCKAFLTEAAFLLKRGGVDTDPLFVRLERDGGPPLRWARMWLMGAGENSLGTVSHRESVTAPPIHEFGPFSGPQASKTPKTLARRAPSVAPGDAQISDAPAAFAAAPPNAAGLPR